MKLKRLEERGPDWVQTQLIPTALYDDKDAWASLLEDLYQQSKEEARAQRLRVLPETKVTMEDFTVIGEGESARPVTRNEWKATKYLGKFKPQGFFIVARWQTRRVANV